MPTAPPAPPVAASRYPALFHGELFPALKSLSGDIGARQLIRHLDRDIVTTLFALPEDVDTPARRRAVRPVEYC